MNNIDKLAERIKKDVDKLANTLNADLPGTPYYQTIDIRELDERWAKTEYFVRATDEGKDYLFNEYAKEDWVKTYIFNKSCNCLEWGNGSGQGVTIGWLKRLDGEQLPVLITCMWYTIEGHLIGFYCCNSMVSDSQLVEDFLDFHFPLIKRTNVSNFFNCLDDLGIKIEVSTL